MATYTYPCVCCGGTDCWPCAPTPQPATFTFAPAGLVLCPGYSTNFGVTIITFEPTGGFPSTETVTQSEFDPCFYFFHIDYAGDIVETVVASGVEIDRRAVGADYLAFLIGGAMVEAQIEIEGAEDGFDGTAAWVCGTGATVSNAQPCAGIQKYHNGTVTIS